MPRADQPSVPADDIRSLAENFGQSRLGILTEELAAFCESGIGIALGARGPDQRPLAGRALACQVDGSGLVTLFLHRSLNASVLRAITAGSGLAATFTRPETHRSIQLKSDHAREVAVPASALDEIEAQAAAFRHELVSIGYSEAFASDYCSVVAKELTAIAFSPQRAFVQTPGPGAGSALPL